MATGAPHGFEHWKEWQRPYRFGVILILPPEPVRSQVNTLRARYDPVSRCYSDAHVSLTAPLPRLVSGLDWAEFEAVAAAIRPFPVHYGPLMTYLPHPGVVLKIEPQDELDRLRASLEACAAFVGMTPRPHSFSAHMTIAEFITVERTKSLIMELKDSVISGSFLCDGLSHLVPDANFRFSERRKLLFRG